MEEEAKLLKKNLLKKTNKPKPSTHLLYTFVIRSLKLNCSQVSCRRWIIIILCWIIQWFLSHECWNKPERTNVNGVEYEILGHASE